MSTPFDQSRRDLISATAAVGVLATLPATAAEPEGAPRSRAFADLEPVPLPFDPTRLPGLSERLLRSHWDNNYMGSVRALASVNGQLAGMLASKDTPANHYHALKREQLLRRNSVVLHELYFGNLGGDGRPDAAVRTAIAADFGTFDAWETEFRLLGAGLAGGSGWVILGYNLHTRRLENYALADHSHGPAACVPNLVMDMYEHSYHMDYGAAAARYIDAFFANIRWDVVATR
jgi:superoxide dismutase, Fe-Mn family